ncbi:hypothetical protein D9M69_699470 [compost metagenome]
MLVTRVQVGHQNPIGLQLVMTVVVEGLRAQTWRNSIGIESVSNDRVEAIGGCANVVGGLLFSDVESVIVPRHFELVSQCDHVGIDL